jgi:hypothetical protein
MKNYSSRKVKRGKIAFRTRRGFAAFKQQNSKKIKTKYCTFRKKFL